MSSEMAILWWRLIPVLGLLASALVLHATRKRWRGVPMRMEDAAPGSRDPAWEEQHSTRPWSAVRCVVGMCVWAALMLLGLVPMGAQLGRGLLDDELGLLFAAHSVLVVWPLTVSGIVLAFRVAYAATQLAQNALPHASTMSIVRHLRVHHWLGLLVPAPALLAPYLGWLALPLMALVCAPGFWLARVLERTSLRLWAERESQRAVAPSPAFDRATAAEPNG